MEKYIELSESQCGQICDQEGFDTIAKELGLEKLWNNYYANFMSLAGPGIITAVAHQSMFRSMLVQKMRYPNYPIPSNLFD